jgi:hypothetical protein
MLGQIRQLVPVQNAYHYRPDQFTATTFPFEAYSLPISAEAASREDANA